MHTVGMHRSDLHHSALTKAIDAAKIKADDGLAQGVQKFIDSSNSDVNKFIFAMTGDHAGSEKKTKAIS